MAEDTAPPPAEDTAAAEGVAAANPGAKKKKLLMLVCGGVAVVGVIVAAGLFFFSGDKKADAAHEEKHATAIPEIAIYDVPTFTLNLLTEEGMGAKFLKITLALELENSEDAKNMAKLLPRLQDDWGAFLRQLRATDLQGSAGMQRLREGLLRRAMQTLEPIPVKAVYIKDLLVQ
jgi:flagellar FliL protein